MRPSGAPCGSAPGVGSRSRLGPGEPSPLEVARGAATGTRPASVRPEVRRPGPGPRGRRHLVRGVAIRGGWTTTRAASASRAPAAVGAWSRARVAARSSGPGPRGIMLGSSAVARRPRGRPRGRESSTRAGSVTLRLCAGCTADLTALESGRIFESTSVVAGSAGRSSFLSGSSTLGTRVSAGDAGTRYPLTLRALGASRR